MKTKNNILILCFVLLISGCANIGTPEGGPSDEDPPVLIKSTPAIYQTNFKKQKILLNFDEIVVLKDINNNFIISPPLEKDAKITALGKKVSIDINNELLDSTTYTIYLGSSIVDNNQGNPLKDFTFSFSTGPIIDSMEFSGSLLNAENLEPIENAIVGIYADLSDSAVIKTAPLRISQTNENGEFIIKNIAPGKYHIFGLPEMIRNYKYDNSSDKIAFLDSVFIPDYDTIQIADTLWADSITIDTIIIKDALKYGPNDITLLAFSEFVPSKNLRKQERSKEGRLLFSFSTANDTLPRLRLLDTVASNWYLTELSITEDSVLYWITDSNIYKQDTLLFEMDYLKTDSLMVDRWQTDTLKMVYRRPKVSAKKKKSRKKEPVVDKKPSLSYETNMRKALHINERIHFEFEEPIKDFHKDSLHLFLAEDTLKKEIPLKLLQDQKRIRRFTLVAKLNPGESYTLEIDSAAATSIYGIPTDRQNSTFTVNKEDQYGNLQFNLIDQKEGGIVRLLDSKARTIRQQTFTANQQKVSFKLLLPGEYFAMLFYDNNNDGIWSTGNYLKHQQAEEVRYFSKKLTIKAYRDYEEDWRPESLPITRQKPAALIGLKE